MTKLTPAGGAAYPAYSIGSRPFPVWLRFYSVLPGNVATDCANPPLEFVKDGNLVVEVANCAAANQLQTAALLNRIRHAILATENRFGSSVQIMTASITIFPLEVGIWSRDTQRLRSDRLTLRLLGRYNPEHSHFSETALVRTIAHELFHLARVALRKQRGSEPADIASEEVSASLFESCIQYDVYRKLDPSHVVLDRQVNPDQVASDPVLHASSQGNEDAMRLLSSMIGNDLVLAQENNRASFFAMCKRLLE